MECLAHRKLASLHTAFVKQRIQGIRLVSVDGLLCKIPELAPGPVSLQNGIRRKASNGSSEEKQLTQGFYKWN